MAQVIVVPFDGQEIGQGFNSETRESIGTGLMFDAVSEDPAADGQNVSTQFESISTQDNLMEALGMSTSVDARYALFSGCLLYTSDAADEEDSVDLGGRRIIKKK